MPRLRRAATALVPVLLIPALVACGTKTGYGDKTVSGFGGVSVKGAFGKKPTLSWKAAIAYPSSTKVTTMIRGKGPKVADGKDVMADVYVGDGSTKATTWSYASQSPEVIGSTVSPVFGKLLDGARIGDRRAAIVKSSDLFGSTGAPQYAVGNHDSLVVVLDVVADPNPHDVAAGQLPKLQQKGGKPVGFDFKGTAKPAANGSLLRAVLKKGKGKKVTQDMTVTANYLGMTYGATKPFDESYSKKPAAFPLTQVVPGWTYGLSGLTVGSRVLLQIPPLLGYGEKAQPAADKTRAGIPANSTLYFVIDILSAKATSSSSTGQ